MSVTRLGFRRGLVVGEVSLWGKVVLAKHGYRSEFAYPKRLILVPGEDVSSAQRDELAVDYGVPVSVMTADALSAIAAPVQIDSIQELMGGRR